MPSMIASLMYRRKALFLPTTFASCFGSHECFAPGLASGPTLRLVDSSRPCIRLLVLLLRVHNEHRVIFPASIFFLECLA
jgi:hypothetical protein